MVCVNLASHRIEYIKNIPYKNNIYKPKLRRAWKCMIGNAINDDTRLYTKNNIQFKSASPHGICKENNGKHK